MSAYMDDPYGNSPLVQEIVRKLSISEPAPSSQNAGFSLPIPRKGPEFGSSSSDPAAWQREFANSVPQARDYLYTNFSKNQGASDQQPPSRSAANGPPQIQIQALEEVPNPNIQFCVKGADISPDTLKIALEAASIIVNSAERIDGIIQLSVSHTDSILQLQQFPRIVLGNHTISVTPSYVNLCLYPLPSSITSQSSLVQLLQLSVASTTLSGISECTITEPIFGPKRALIKIAADQEGSIPDEICFGRLKISKTVMGFEQQYLLYSQHATSANIVKFIQREFGVFVTHIKVSTDSGTSITVVGDPILVPQKIMIDSIPGILTSNCSSRVRLLKIPSYLPDESCIKTLVVNQTRIEPQFIWVCLAADLTFTAVMHTTAKEKEELLKLKTLSTQFATVPKPLNTESGSKTNSTFYDTRYRDLYSSTSTPPTDGMLSVSRNNNNMRGEYPRTTEIPVVQPQGSISQYRTGGASDIYVRQHIDGGFPPPPAELSYSPSPRPGNWNPVTFQDDWSSKVTSGYSTHQASIPKQSDVSNSIDQSRGYIPGISQGHLQPVVHFMQNPPSPGTSSRHYHSESGKKEQFSFQEPTTTTTSVSGTSWPRISDHFLDNEEQSVTEQITEQHIQKLQMHFLWHKRHDIIKRYALAFPGLSMFDFHAPQKDREKHAQKDGTPPHNPVVGKRPGSVNNRSEDVYFIVLRGTPAAVAQAKSFIMSLANSIHLITFQIPFEPNTWKILSTRQKLLQPTDITFYLRSDRVLNTVTVTCLADQEDSRSAESMMLRLQNINTKLMQLHNQVLLENCKQNVQRLSEKNFGVVTWIDSKSGTMKITAEYPEYLAITPLILSSSPACLILDDTIRIKDVLTKHEILMEPSHFQSIVSANSVLIGFPLNSDDRLAILGSDRLSVENAKKSISRLFDSLESPLFLHRKEISLTVAQFDILSEKNNATRLLLERKFKVQFVVEMVDSNRRKIPGDAKTILIQGTQEHLIAVMAELERMARGNYSENSTSGVGKYLNINTPPGGQ